MSPWKYFSKLFRSFEVCNLFAGLEQNSIVLRRKTISLWFCSTILRKTKMSKRVNFKRTKGLSFFIRKWCKKVWPERIFVIWLLALFFQTQCFFPQSKNWKTKNKNSRRTMFLCFTCFNISLETKHGWVEVRTL